MWECDLSKYRESLCAHQSSVQMTQQAVVVLLMALRALLVGLPQLVLLAVLDGGLVLGLGCE